MTGAPVTIERLQFVSLTVTDLGAAASWYEAALGFVAGPVQACDPALAALLGARRIDTIRLARGGQTLQLVAFDPPGAPYPPGGRANDPWFQHCALTTQDMAAAYARLCRFGFTPVSLSGPQTLPAGAGGVTAFKFRDPDGHPLELIRFPDRAAAADGIDHSAIAVADAGRSIGFYERLGLRVSARGVNTGPAQDALDGLNGVTVDVVALMPPAPAPHLELLGYRSPAAQPARAHIPADIAASRLVFAATGLDAAADAVRLHDGTLAALRSDPDGHGVLLLGS